jgi:hypothetical protein
MMCEYQRYIAEHNEWLSSIKVKVQGIGKPFVSVGAKHSHYYSSQDANKNQLNMLSPDLLKLIKSPRVTRDGYLLCTSAHRLSECDVIAERHGFMMSGLPEIKDITIGGAISTDVHGGGFSYTPFSEYVETVYSLDKNFNLRKGSKETIIVFAKIKLFRRTNFAVSYSWKQNVSVDDLNLPHLHSVHFFTLGQILEFRQPTILPVTENTNLGLQTYSKLSTSQVPLSIVSTALSYCPSLSRLIQSANLLPITHVKPNMFSTVPSIQAYTMEFIVHEHHFKAALFQMKKVIVDLQISYRCWLRTMTQDEQKCITCEITVEYKQSNAKSIMRQFVTLLEPFSRRLHAGKTQITDIA